jgi:hypothetical protein
VLEKGERGIIWTNHVKAEYILHKAEKERSVRHAIKRKKANWIGHILHRNRLLKHVIKGKIEGTGRQGRRCKKLVEDLSEERRY